MSRTGGQTIPDMIMREKYDAKVVTDFGFGPKRDDLISRAAAIGAFDDERVDRNYGDVSPESVIGVIESIPAVDAVSVRHGRWIDENPDDSLDPRMRCSICAGIESPLIKWRYCPNCGAKMDGERRESK